MKNERRVLMTVKIGELAKKLNIANKEVVTQAQAMGIVAKTASSSITEEEAIAIENALLNEKESNETKVVQAKVKKVTATNESEPKIKVKAAKVVMQANLSGGQQTTPQATTTNAQGAPKTGVKRTPIGRPITKAEAENRRRPAGKPITKKEKVEKDAIAAKEKEAIIAKKAAEEKANEIEKKKKEETVPKAVNVEKAEEKQETFARPKIVKRAEDIKREEKEKKQKEKERERDNLASAVAPSEPHSKSDNRKSSKKDKDREKERNREKEGKNARRKDKRRRDDGLTKYAEGSLEKKTRKKAQKKAKPEVEQEVEAEPIPVGTKVINIPITVAGYCEQVGVSVSQVIMTLMKLGIVTNINANLDEDTALILSEELGVSVVIGQVEEEQIDEGFEDFEDKEEQLVSRPPIITVMGHVDHGKTSLLDAIRATNVTASESGGITQHIGASEVRLKDHRIVFLDTPGHEAFTAMRARGADITDIAVLVVAADDSVKPQTIESISHAKAAGVPMIVAINKMDKPGANPDMVKTDLAENGVLVEDWGGDVISVPVSAKTGEGVENLLEMILLQAEVLELKANPKRLGLGTVIEARLDKAKGSVATLLVTNGTVKTGQSIVAGNTSGRIRLMTDYKGTTIKKAGPATAVEVLGLTDVPAAGDDFHVVKDDKLAREIAEKRKTKQREEILARNASSTLEELFSQIKEGEVKDLNLIVKGDVMGSVGAVVSSLEKLTNEEVRIKIIHSGVGAITETDVTLASTSGAVIIGFNVRPAASVQSIADRENVQIRTYRVIYNIIDDVENAMRGMLDPEFKEVVMGQAEIRETFKVPNVGTVGGAYVTDGSIARNASVRIVRDGIVIHEGKMASLRRFKDDVREVQQGYECGIGIENFNDIKEGDIIECFKMEEVARD